jgi:SpoIID/LytB domain protein
LRKSLTTILAVAAAACTAFSGVLLAPPAAAYPEASITFVGHGYGHGRGMGQYGAYGYAHDYGWDYQQILSHYYGGTYLATAPIPSISVTLAELQGASDVTLYVPGAKLSADGITASALRIHSDGNGSYTVYPQSGCTASTVGGSPPVTSVTVNPPSPDNTQATVIEVCQLGMRAYQGSFTVSGGATVDTLPLDEYVAGVVPAESIASWGAEGGEAALQAQAVAARSYAVAYAASAGGICDNQSCQMYLGDPDLGANAYYAVYTDEAVTSTAKQVLDCSAGSACGAAGSVAFTEYSSSTGGYTAGGAFPAVPDVGDATASNPNHDWTATVSVASIQAAYPQIGTLTAISITQRNGLGDMGGRVLSMALSGTGGSVTVSGQSFAWAVNLMSNWFNISEPVTGPQGGIDGYWVVGRDATVFTFGAAPYYGSLAGDRLNAPVISMAPTPDQHGYWMIAGDGGVFTFGDAPYYGSTGGLRLNKPVIGMVPTPDGKGYWLVAADGGVFTFGDAPYYGSTGGLRLNKPVVGMAVTPDGKGYWLVAADGGVFTFGDARYYGSTAALKLNRPIVGLIPTADGAGYWLVASDGGVFTLGDAHYVGSLPAEGAHDTVVGLSPTADNGGYELVGSSGSVYPFGDAPFFGDVPSAYPGYSAGVLDVANHRQA